MDIKEEIQRMSDYLNEISGERFIHYRELFPKITIDDYFTCTKVDYKEVKPMCENVKESWVRLKHSLGNEVIYTYKSKTGSEYFSTKNEDMYRLSDHWGACASCEWTLDGTGELRMSIMYMGPLQIGVANLKDFVIFRRRDDRRRDIVVNPQWQEKLKTIIPISETLRTIVVNENFKLLPDEEKAFYGESYGKFHSLIKHNRIK